MQDITITEQSLQQDKHYDYDMIKKMAKKMNRIKSKKNLIDIIKIIKAMNPDLPITENANGMFIKFNQLTQDTYVKLDNYIHKNITKKLSDDSEAIVSEYVPYSPDEIDSMTDKYKLSNKEKTLIKKQKYSQIAIV
jgi:hypothetical protein